MTFFAFIPVLALGIAAVAGVLFLPLLAGQCLCRGLLGIWEALPSRGPRKQRPYTIDL